MRVTARAKRETRARLLAAARELFVERGYERASRRDLATAVGIAPGTIFNYFPSKEALAMEILAEALRAGASEFEARPRDEETLDEVLFAHLAAGLRELAPFRGFAGEVLETALSPFSRSPSTDVAAEVRAEHLGRVAALVAEHGYAGPLDFVGVHLYWTLALGVLAHWSTDASPHQEDTLVVLDRSMKLFARALEGTAAEREGDR